MFGVERKKQKKRIEALEYLLTVCRRPALSCSASLGPAAWDYFMQRGYRKTSVGTVQIVIWAIV